MEQQQKDIANATYLLKDLISGDDSVAERGDFVELNVNQIQKAYNTIISNPNLSDRQKQYLMANSWRIHYHHRPFTINEFLTEAVLGPTAQEIYPKTREILGEYWDFNSPYRKMILASSIGTGKSYMSVLSNLYIVANLWCMRDHKKFFKINKAIPTLLALISFTLDKASQTLLQPFVSILESSPLFKRVRQEEKLQPKQQEHPDRIVWTTAGRVGSLQFSHDAHIMLASSASSLLGMSMISGTLSEISFFIEKGFSPEYIWKMFNDTLGRVYSRFGWQYYATTILDSSPNDIEFSPIDKYIFQGDALKDPRNYVVTGAQWEFVPWKYPKWLETKETFPVFRGNSRKPAEVINPDERDQYNQDEIYDVPIDLKQNFIDYPVKSVKDYCGWPSGTQGRLIPDYRLIEDIFDQKLKNIYTHIYAPERESPEGLIWESIKSKFFIDLGENRYRIYRAPFEKRYLHVDQSETGDVTGIAMVHPETGSDGEMVMVHDFVFAIHPHGQRINLDAIFCFILDLRDKGGINFGVVSFDMHQSSATRQRLQARGINVERVAVGLTNVNPYLLYISYLHNGRIKAGYNLYLKNNLKSIQEVRTQNNKRSIDHMKGKVEKGELTHDWDNSRMGYFANDVSDGAVGAVWDCIQHYKGVPRYQWVNGVERGKEEPKGKLSADERGQRVKEEVLRRVREKHHLQPLQPHE